MCSDPMMVSLRKGNAQPIVCPKAEANVDLNVQKNVETPSKNLSHVLNNVIFF